MRTKRYTALGPYLLSYYHDESGDRYIILSRIDSADQRVIFVADGSGLFTAGGDALADLITDTGDDPHVEDDWDYWPNIDAEGFPTETDKEANERD